MTAINLEDLFSGRGDDDRCTTIKAAQDAEKDRMSKFLATFTASETERNVFRNIIADMAQAAYKLQGQGATADLCIAGAKYFVGYLERCKDVQAMLTSEAEFKTAQGHEKLSVA